MALEAWTASLQHTTMLTVVNQHIATNLLTLTWRRYFAAGVATLHRCTDLGQRNMQNDSILHTYK